MVIPPRRWLVVSHQWSLQETKLYTQHRAHKNHSALTRRESLGVEDKQNIPRTMARCGTMKKHWERKHWNFTPLHMDSLVSNLQTHYLQLFFIATQQLQVFRHIVWMPQFCISKGLNAWSDVTHNPGIGKDTIPAAWYWWVMVRPNLLKVSWLFQRKPSAYLKCSYVRRLHALGVITCIISALNLWMEIYWRYIYIYTYICPTTVAGSNSCLPCLNSPKTFLEGISMSYLWCLCPLPRKLVGALVTVRHLGSSSHQFEDGWFITCPKQSWLHARRFWTLACCNFLRSHWNCLKGSYRSMQEDLHFVGRM